MKIVIILLQTFTLVNSSYERKQALRIIKGFNATSDRFPYVVRLVQYISTGIDTKCTGSLLSETWTISAAHCHPLTHIAGRVVENQNVAKILENHLHPNYFVMDAEANNYNDIALYKTEKFVGIYAALNSKDYISLNGFEVTVVGYGLTDWDKYKTIEPQSYVKYTKGIVHSECLKKSKDQFTMPNFCVMRRCKDDSNGYSSDSGGPVIFEGRIVGINIFIDPADTFMNGVGQGRIIVAATPVSVYLDWIRRTIHSGK